MPRLAKFTTSFKEREYGDESGKPGDKSPRAANPTPFKRNKVFVVMPFDEEGMSRVYAVIKEECGKLKLKAVRADEVIGSGTIHKDILTVIEQAEFIICDLTHERQNVYYEIGYAHGVGNYSSNIFLIARKGTTLHFDIRSLRVNFYRDISHLRYFISHEFKQMVRQARLAEQRSL